jgi:hypothetical protein
MTPEFPGLARASVQRRRPRPKLPALVRLLAYAGWLLAHTPARLVRAVTGPVHAQARAAVRDRRDMHGTCRHVSND